MEFLILPLGLVLILAVGFLIMVTVPATAVAFVLRAMDPRFRAYEMTDGGRTVVFVEMIHVGTPAYYEAVRKVIADHGEAGATYLYERVGKGTPEEEARLRALLGFDIGSRAQREMLEFVARAGGMVIQPHDSFLGLTGRPDVNADLTVSEILARLPPGVVAAPSAVATGNDRIVGLRTWVVRLGFLDGRNPVRRWIARQVVLGAIRLSIVQRLSQPPAKTDADGIMAARDAHLAATVAATPGDLVITYGAAHLRPFLRMSPNLRVVRTFDLPLV